MIVAGALGAWAVLLALFVPPALRGRHFAERSPRLGIFAWQAASVSVLVALVLAGMALAAPSSPFSTNLASILSACLMALERGYATPGGTGVAMAGVVLSVAVAARSLGCLAIGLARSARERARHAEVLRLVARASGHRGAVVLDHATPAAYCLPGRHRRVVVTSGALAALDEAQLDAVLAHERAHLAGRHHLVVGAATALRRAFPRVPLFVHSETEIARLVELTADDVAAVRHGRLAVASAMVAVASGDAPSMAMAAGGAAALERVHRLLGPARPLGLSGLLAGLAACGALVVLPALAAASPALAAERMAPCPMATTAPAFSMGPNCNGQHPSAPVPPQAVRTPG